jgi:hypothetical protein
MGWGLDAWSYIYWALICVVFDVWFETRVVTVLAQ